MVQVMNVCCITVLQPLSLANCTILKLFIKQETAPSRLFLYVIIYIHLCLFLWWWKLKTAERLWRTKLQLGVKPECKLAAISLKFYDDKIQFPGSIYPEKIKQKQVCNTPYTSTHIYMYHPEIYFMKSNMPNISGKYSYPCILKKLRVQTEDYGLILNVVLNWKDIYIENITAVLLGGQS